METYHKKSGEKLKEYVEYIGIPSQLSTLSFSVSFWKILPYTHTPHRGSSSEGQGWKYWGGEES